MFKVSTCDLFFYNILEIAQATSDHPGGLVPASGRFGSLSQEGKMIPEIVLLVCLEGELEVGM